MASIALQPRHGATFFLLLSCSCVVLSLTLPTRHNLRPAHGEISKPLGQVTSNVLKKTRAKATAKHVPALLSAKLREDNASTSLDESPPAMLMEIESDGRIDDADFLKELRANHTLEELEELLKREDNKPTSREESDHSEQNSEFSCAEEPESGEWEQQQLRTIRECFMADPKNQTSYPLLLPNSVWLYERGEGTPPSEPDPLTSVNNSYTVLYHSYFETVIEIREDNVGWIRFTQRAGAPVMYCFSSSKVVQGYYPHNETRAPMVLQTLLNNKNTRNQKTLQHLVNPAANKTVELGRWVVYEKMFGEQKCVIFKNQVLKSVLILIGNGFIFLGWGPRALSITQGCQIRFLHSRSVRTAVQEFSEDELEATSRNMTVQARDAEKQPCPPTRAGEGDG